jgi:hypothetical protein
VWVRIAAVSWSRPGRMPEVQIGHRPAPSRPVRRRQARARPGSAGYSSTSAPPGPRSPAPRASRRRVFARPPIGPAPTCTAARPGPVALIKYLPHPQPGWLTVVAAWGVDRRGAIQGAKGRLQVGQGAIPDHESTET